MIFCYLLQFFSKKNNNQSQHKRKGVKSSRQTTRKVICLILSDKRGAISGFIVDRENSIFLIVGGEANGSSHWPNHVNWPETFTHPNKALMGFAILAQILSLSLSTPWACMWQPRHLILLCSICRPVNINLGYVWLRSGKEQNDSIPIF